ncbi:chemotaxis protein [Mycobacterium kubicae]|uniref:chemotaxis protein n=3 Tax=Mycobacterium TaxID=1763 RepID=UPI00185F9B7F|nr:chemotaxis protein [Mycobacterium kubicae]QNI15380.1 chemotaxis protein [Mycobacterium kubicae]
MTSYGSVLPPQGAPAASPVGSPPAAPSVPAEAGGGSPGAGAGLMPVAGRRDVVTVRKEDAWSDLEQAKMWVAELAGAAKVTDPGVDWAVAVGHNASGMPTYWVATNDGATYIPPGVFVRKVMPIAGGHDADFDARWFGWVNPADKAVRAAREFGDTVSAVATSWALPSEYLAEHPTPQVAYGVKPSLEPDNAAAKLSQPRAHRLQTVDAALYADLVAAGESVVRDYCRELVRQLVFGIPGEELSAVAQSVGQALVAGRRPSAAEWALLGEEHQDALVQMACQRPGLNGLENPDQTVSYTREFVRCRQLEALLCWEYYGDDPLNVVYAAWVAGIRAPLAKNGGLTVG